ncbi:MAG: hypothetical protein KGI68_09145 [Alphaproteobacteria bacterium]|nr:hypothetical protein [Alphaproteobacteria bacterium]MDE1986578.1 hypothetical protein [Alphaproteobacteria bacterium]MDE2164552.1 hypothetical protein [Alphaproteobacteria bacterium]MDE2265847.1 hypothetical protein [Alphaproteobacteria bacterium]MDE2500863.1 hypothetical protein [Alphaproteobacteria bacterium]
MSLDPNLLIAGLGLVAVSYLLALTWKLIRLRRLRAAMAPRPQAKIAPSMLMAAHQSSAPVQVAAGNAKTIAIIHDFGLPYGQQSDERMYLSVREAFEVLAQIRSVGKETPIEIILHTPGGSAFACELIASALKDRPNTTAYVPYCAMSAGTIIALATEKVVMGRYACLGPIDTQYDIFPAESFKRLLKEKPIQNMDDITVLLAYQAEKDLKNARERACELLNKKHSGNDDACQLTDFLVSGDMPHSEQINRERAIQFGVNVAKEDCPDAVYRLVESRLSLLRSSDGRGGLGPDLKAKPD